jgi:hypothetical protein
VAHLRVIASEAAFGVNFLAETVRCAQHLTKLFMFLYQKGVRSQRCSHQVALSAVHWQVAPTVTNHLVRCSRSVIISPYVVSRASLLGRRTYLNARYSTSTHHDNNHPISPPKQKPGDKEWYLPVRIYTSLLQKMAPTQPAKPIALLSLGK